MFHRISDGHGPFRLYIKKEIMANNFGPGKFPGPGNPLWMWTFLIDFSEGDRKGKKNYQINIWLPNAGNCVNLSMKDTTFDVAATIGASN